MLYKIGNGANTGACYGLKLAAATALPRNLISRGEELALELTRRLEVQKYRSTGGTLSRRRNVLLGLREALIQTNNGRMDDDTLRRWLDRLQQKFSW